MGIREEWLDDDEAVYNINVVEKLLAYAEYVRKHYPEIHKIVDKEIN